MSKTARYVTTAMLTALMLAVTVPSEAGPISVLAYYRMGDADPGATIGNTANATTVDSSGNGQTLTRSGSPTYAGGSPYDPAGIAVNFTGVAGQSFSKTEINAGTNNFGIEAWVNASSTTGNHVIAYNGNSSTTGFGIFQAGNQFGFLYGGVDLLGVANVITGQWFHLALVRDSGTTMFFVDDVLVSSTLHSPNALNGTGFMTIGGNPLNLPEAFNGSISEVRLFTFAAGQFSTNDLLNVPEPASLALLGLGLAGLGFSRRKLQA